MVGAGCRCHRAVMDDLTNELLASAFKRLQGYQRREFQAEVCRKLCGGSPRQAEQHFGWYRETIVKGFREQSREIEVIANPSRRGRERSEDANPQLASDIRLIVEPHTQSDPEIKSSRQYTNFSAGEVRQELIEKVSAEAVLPRERTTRDIFNRLNYRLKRIQKGDPRSFAGGRACRLNR